MAQTMTAVEKKAGNVSLKSKNSLSNAELDYMLEGCDDDFRVDGRACADIRPYSINGSSKTNSSPSTLVLSNGSARVSLPGGSTDIICSTKAEIARPALLKPNEGIVDVNVDYFSSSMHNNKRQRRHEETELSQIISRLVLPNALSLPSLCILPGKYCWKISIDVLVLATDGCVTDVASMAIYKALNNTVLPVVKPIPKQTESSNTGVGNKSNVRDDFIIESGDVAEALIPDGADDCPILLTVCILQQQNPFFRDGTKRKHSAPAVMVLDCRLEEEMCALTKICVSVDRQGMICGVLKFGAGQGALPYRMLTEITDLAVLSSKKIFEDILIPDMNDDDMNQNEMTIANRGDLSDFLHGHFNFQ